MNGPTNEPPPPTKARSALEVEIMEDIRGLEVEIAQERTAAAGLPSRLESSALISLGGLGLLGSGQVTSWLLQWSSENSSTAQADFALSVLLAVQKGLEALGNGGKATAFALGCLMVLGLVAQHILGRTRPEEEESQPPSWPPWALALTLVILPFYNFSQIQPAVNFFVGMAVSCGLYAVVLLLQKSEVLQRLFSQFDHWWFGTAIGIIAIALIAAGFLGDRPRWAYLGIVLASCLSIQMLSLGLQGKAHAASYAAKNARRRALYERLAQERKEQRIREELRRFIGG